MAAIFTVVSSLLVGGMLAWWTWRTATNTRDRLVSFVSLAALFIITGLAGATGVLSDFSRVPPPMGLFIGALFALAIGVTLTPWGSRIADASSLRLLVGMQAFRILPETLLLLAWREGLAPVQMTMHGRNFDVLTVLAALLLAVAWPRLRHPRPWAWAFTLLGCGLLLNIVAIAVLSMPLPIRVFFDEPANTFVATFPYIWLPGIHVFTALLLHAMTIRKLLR